MTTATAVNYLPTTSDDFRRAFVFGMDIADRLGITLCGLHVARHAGLELHCGAFGDTEALSDVLGLDAGHEEGQTNWTRRGTVDAGFPGRLIVTVYGPRREDSSPAEPV